MRKLQKNQLKLDKEIISSLSENELSFYKGGSQLPASEFQCATQVCASKQMDQCVTTRCGNTYVNDSCPCVDTKGDWCNTRAQTCHPWPSREIACPITVETCRP